MSAALDVRPSSVTTTGFADGLGRRSIRFDRELGTTLECLHVRPELAAFESALRTQAAAVNALDDERLVRVRSFDRDHAHLDVTSELVAGDRLSDIIDARASGDSAVSGIDAAFGFLLQVLPALSTMHAASLVHGALAPGRIVITTNAQVVLCDAIYGIALPHLNLTRRRLWTELGIAAPPSAGSVRLDASSDVSQAALSALMLALGRQISGPDPASSLAGLVEEVAEIAQIRGGDPLAEGVRRFFAAALPSGRRTILSAEQAAAAVRLIANLQLGEDTCLAALGEFARYESPSELSVPEAPLAVPVGPLPVLIEPTPVCVAPAAADSSPVLEESPVLDPIPVLAVAPIVVMPAVEPSAPVHVARPAETVVRVKAEPPAGYVPQRIVRTLDVQPAVVHRRFPWKVAAAAAVILSAGAVAGRGYLQAPEGLRPIGVGTVSAPDKAALAPTTGRLSIDSQPAGARVLLDGKDAGQTPLRLDSVAAGRHAITVATETASVQRTVRVEAGRTLALDIPVFSGWVNVFAPIVLEVAEGNRSLGSTEQGRILLSPGRHTLTLTHRAFGYSSVHTVQIVAGQEEALNLTPTGVVSVNAQPWAEVWIDGARAGETPLANLQVALGTREFLFRHPQYGDRRLTATITSTGSALSVDLTKPSLKP